MSRSQGYQAQPGSYPAQGQPPAEQDPQAAWNPPAPPRQARPAAPPQSQAFQQLAYPQQGEPAYHDPYAPAQGQGYYAPQPAAPQAQPQHQPYAPQFETYAPAPAPQPAPAAYHPQAYQQNQHYGYAQPQTEAARPELRGSTFEQWASAAPAQDPRGFDLGSYAPPQAAQPAYQPAYEPQFAQPAAQAQAPQQQWSQPETYAPQYGQQPIEPSFDPQGYDQGQQQAVAAGEGYEDDQGYEPEPSRPRAMMIAAALAGAIFVGGGLAYTYSALMGGPTEGAPPVVKSDSAPTKVKPSDPGGKQFAHSDSKVMGRLGEGTGSAAAASDDADSTGARKVSTLVVGRDGSIQPPSEPEAAAPAPVAAAGLPGMSVIDIAGAAQSSAEEKLAEAKAAAAPVQAAVVNSTKAAAADAKAAAEKKIADKAAALAAQAPVVVNPPVAAKPQKLAAAAPAVPATTQSIDQDIGAAPAAAAAPAKPAPAKKVAAVAPAPAASAPAPTGAGYVAVLASVPVSGNSRMDALKQFADMQQKYGPVLQNKTPDVQEANLGDKGKYHRLVVGPPGSKEGANSVCSQLKSSGYTDCWVMAY